MMTMRVWIDPRKVTLLSVSNDHRWITISVAGIPEKIRLHKVNGIPYIEFRHPYEPVAEFLHEEIYSVTIQDFIDPPKKFLPEGIYRHQKAEVTVKTTRERNSIVDYCFQTVFVKAANIRLAQDIHSLVLQRIIDPVEAWS